MILYNTGDFFAFRAELGTNFARSKVVRIYSPLIFSIYNSELLTMET